MEEKSLDKLEFNKSIKVCSFKDNPKKKKKGKPQTGRNSYSKTCMQNIQRILIVNNQDK